MATRLNQTLVMDTQDPREAYLGVGDRLAMAVELLTSALQDLNRIRMEAMKGDADVRTRPAQFEGRDEGNGLDTDGPG